MTKNIKLTDIDITQLSTEALNLLSMVTLRIRKISGTKLQFSDPRLLEKVSYRYKRINDPELNELYKQYKLALRQSIHINMMKQSIV